MDPCLASLFTTAACLHTHKRTHIHPPPHRYESVKYALLSVFSGNMSPTQTNKTNTDIGYTKVVESLDTKIGLFHSAPFTGLQHLKDCLYLNIFIIGQFSQTKSVGFKISASPKSRKICRGFCQEWHPMYKLRKIKQHVLYTSLVEAQVNNDHHQCF